MKAILAAVARAVLGAVVILIFLAAMLWAAYGPQGFWTVAWLLTVAAVTFAATQAWLALFPEEGGGRDG